MLKYDETMRRDYEARHRKSIPDLRFVLTPGMKVLVRSRVPGKLEASWEGPWTVLRLLGPADSAVEVLTSEYKARVVAVSNVKPYRRTEPVRVAKRLRLNDDWVGHYSGAGGAEWDSSSEDAWGSDDG